MISRKRWLLPTVILIALVAGLAVFQPWQKSDAAPHYRLAKIERGALSAAVSASGTLSALVTVQVGSQVSGLIKEIRADFNSAVKQNQVIARLDPESFESRVMQAEADLKAAESATEVARGNLAVRQAEVNKAQIALDEALRNLERNRSLIAQGSLSTAELDTAQSATDTAREQLRLAKADAGVATAQVGNAQAQAGQRRAALNQARIELERTVIRSPVDGVVISRNVDVGQTVAASFQAPVLFTIARDLRQMEVNVAVDEADVGRVQTGQKMRFTVDAFPGERVMATLDNPDLKLLPGMTASARILTEERKGVLILPNEALRFRPMQADGTPIKLEVRGREDGPGIPGRIWVLKDNQPTAISVRLGVSDGKKTEMLKGEIAEGAEIILGMIEGNGANAAKPSRPFGGGM